MTKTIGMICAIIAAGTLFYYVPAIKVKSYEREVESLAFSYRVYKSNVCPNRKILSDVRSEYVSTINKGNITKIGWVHDNFDSKFMEYCLTMNPHRGDYR